jgi:cytochrome c oxidase cbb3-type subunit III
MRCNTTPNHKEMHRLRPMSISAALMAISCLLAIAAVSFGAPAKTLEPTAIAQAAGQVEAKATYESVCAACHGLDARGGERGPNLATRPEVIQKSDKELFEILKNGRTAAGMPSFSSFGADKLASLVAYLRTLQGQGKEEPLPGDPAAGKILFYGKAKCADCHMIGGQGGFWGPELTSYAARMNADEVRGRIVHTGKDFDLRRGLVDVTLANSTTISGLVRNEDNFSLQLQTSDGVFHLLSKADLKSNSYTGHSPMPSDYGSTLSATELNDLVSYLLSASGSGNSKMKNRGPEDGDEE